MCKDKRIYLWRLEIAHMSLHVIVEFNKVYYMLTQEGWINGWIDRGGMDQWMDR